MAVAINEIGSGWKVRARDGFSRRVYFISVDFFQQFSRLQVMGREIDERLSGVKSTSL